MTEPRKLEDTNNIDFVRIVELISKYEQIKKSGEIKKYNEESTKKDFILPLFEALGWNVYNRGKRSDSISAEETISKKRVDYGFRINGIPKVSPFPVCIVYCNCFKITQYCPGA